MTREILEGASDVTTLKMQLRNTSIARITQAGAHHSEGHSLAYKSKICGCSYSLIVPFMLCFP